MLARPVRSWTVIALLILPQIFFAKVMADEPSSVQFTLGVKGWVTDWTSWVPQRSGANQSITVVEQISSNEQLVAIPQASMRYGKWLVSASYFANTTYTLSGGVDPVSGNAFSISAQRQEYDANIGYSILPSVVLTAGYKHISQAFGANESPYNWSGPTIGLAASAPLSANWALYASAADGFLHLRVDSSLADDAGHTSFPANYSLAELGLAYALPSSIAWLSFSVTAGYRVQIVSTRDYALSTGFGGYTTTKVHDTTQGPAVTLVGRF
jgi:hypothetical protein